MTKTDLNPELKRQVATFYDKLSPFWHKLCGIHVHHGYWITGKETKERAQEQLTAELAKRVGIKAQMKILNVGCGMGGSSVYLSKRFDAETAGITLSPVQVEIATQIAMQANANSRFMVMDAEQATLNDRFDIVWSVEAVSHFSNPENFFVLDSRVLKPDGRIALIDWFEAPNLSAKRKRKYIEPINKGMLVPAMTTMADYCEFAVTRGFNLLYVEDISTQVAKSWDIGLKIIAKPDLWKTAAKEGKIFLDYLKAVRSMKRGFASKTFQYGIIIAEKA